jgi:hypothetical protein
VEGKEWRESVSFSLMVVWWGYKDVCVTPACGIGELLAALMIQLRHIKWKKKDSSKPAAAHASSSIDVTSVLPPCSFLLLLVEA